MYFQPMATGFFKVYGEETTKFWCCTGTGMENFTKLSDSIYYEDDKNLYLAMYFSSKVQTKDGAEYEIKADLKASDKVEIKVLSTGENSKKLALRKPYWLNGEIAVQVNGKAAKIDQNERAGFAIIDAELKEGDLIEVTLPMTVYAKTLPDSDSALAICYGPYVLSADLGIEDKKVTTTGVIVTIPEKAIVKSQVITIPDGMSALDFVKNIEDYVHPVATHGHGIAFKVNGCEYIFAPHYLKYQERYGIYFYYKNEKEQLADSLKNTAGGRNVVDTIEAGYGQYENDELHNMIDNGSIGTTSPVTSRRAALNGSFTYQMAIEKGRQNYLSITVLTEDDGKTLKISSADEVLYCETLDHNKACVEEKDKYTIEIPIPEKVIAKARDIKAYDKEYSVIAITFEGIDKAESARIVENIYVLL